MGLLGRVYGRIWKIVFEAKRVHDRHLGLRSSYFAFYISIWSIFGLRSLLGPNNWGKIVLLLQDRRLTPDFLLQRLS